MVPRRKQFFFLLQNFRNTDPHTNVEYALQEEKAEKKEKEQDSLL